MQFLSFPSHSFRSSVDNIYLPLVANLIFFTSALPAHPPSDSDLPFSTPRLLSGSVLRDWPPRTPSDLIACTPLNPINLAISLFRASYCPAVSEWLKYIDLQPLQMMVARPYRRASRTLASDRGEVEAEGGSIHSTEATQATEKRKLSAESLSPQRITVIPSVIPSQPVVIPSRARRSDYRRRREKALEIADRPPYHDPQHDRHSIPPAVAALLAMTSIPAQRHARWSRHPIPGFGLVDRGSSRDGKPPPHAPTEQSLGSWGMLLSPPIEADSDGMSLTSDITADPPSSIGSSSSESMPLLETDTESSGSASTPSIPERTILKRAGGEGRFRTSASRSEDCGSDHPLLPTPLPPDSPRLLGLDDLPPLPVQTRLRGASKSTFKSHLTASLRTIKSAAVSWSSWTAPTVQRDDYLARAVLSISLPFTDERRPLWSTGLPDPALRRYLNPVSGSSAELYFHHDPSPQNVCTASIQMRTIRKGDRKSAHATAPPVFASHPRSTPSTDRYTGASTRQREPRENSDFLRVIVLEMNMRRAGKLGQAAPGRARLWLPARSGASASEGTAGIVTRRWVSLVP